MKLILRTSVTHLGEPGDLVEVKRGYARNYLLPKGMAIEATGANMRSISHELDRLREAADAERERARQIASKLENLVLSMERKVADPETGALYGSVSVVDIAEALAENGYEIARGEIHLEHPIKQLGDHEITVSLAHGVKGVVHVSVASEAGDEQSVEAAPTETPVQETAADEAPTDEAVSDEGD